MRAHAISVHFENIVYFEIVYKRMEKNVFVFIKKNKKASTVLSSVLKYLGSSCK